MPTSRNRPMCFFKCTCHQIDNCLYILFLWTTKSKGKISCFSSFETFQNNTLKSDLKECVNSIIKLTCHLKVRVCKQTITWIDVAA